jgi:hypothetical protein
MHEQHTPTTSTDNHSWRSPCAFRCCCFPCCHSSANPSAPIKPAALPARSWLASLRHPACLPALTIPSCACVCVCVQAIQVLPLSQQQHQGPLLAQLHAPRLAVDAGIHRPAAGGCKGSGLITRLLARGGCRCVARMLQHSNTAAWGRLCSRRWNAGCSQAGSLLAAISWCNEG